MNDNICWMFFNCDEWNTWRSCNPSYNDKVYRKRAGRRALWREIKSQVEDEAILINDKEMPVVRDLILTGNPTEASDYITYGMIVALEEAR